MKKDPAPRERTGAATALLPTGASSCLRHAPNLAKDGDTLLELMDFVHSEIPVHYTSFRKKHKSHSNAHFLIVALWAVLGSIFPIVKPVIR